MGYYTDRQLEITDNHGRAAFVDEFLKDIRNLQEAGELIGIEESEYIEMALEQETKWYEEVRDMKIISSHPKFYDWVFVIHCHGEDGEKWKNYYKNGVNVRHTPEIVWPDAPFGL